MFIEYVLMNFSGKLFHDQMMLPLTVYMRSHPCFVITRTVADYVGGGEFFIVYWGLTPQQQPGSYQGGEMMMKSVFWWRKPEYPEEATDPRQVTDETFHTYGLCPVRGLNLGRSGVKQSELRRDESDALIWLNVFLNWRFPAPISVRKEGQTFLMNKWSPPAAEISRAQIQIIEINVHF